MLWKKWVLRRSVTHLSEVGELMIGKSEEVGLVKSFISMHKSVLELSAAYLKEEKRQVFITPSFYIDLIQNMKSLYAKTKGKMEKKSLMYTNGVDKIVETQQFIDHMKDSLEKKKPELEKMNTELAAMQIKLDAMEEEVRPIYERVKREEELVNQEFQKADQLRLDCEEELKVVNAIFEEAKEAVKTITVQDLFAVKSYPQPPKEVRMVMASMCIIFNKKPETDKTGGIDYWPASKLLLNEGMKLLSKLNNISEKELTLKALTKVRAEYITQPKFNPEALKGISMPASAFCKWVLAADKMEDAFRKVLPKKESMKQAEEAAKKMKEELDVKQLELKAYTEKRDTLQRQKEENEKQKKELELEIQLTELRYQRAIILIEALSEEKVSWEEKLDVMKAKLPLMLGDCLLSAGVLVYLGAFSGAYRNKEIEKWLLSLTSQKIIYSDKFSLEESIGDAMEIRKWTIKGLPNDAISREKGLTLYRTTKVPLIIDPQGQANKWIKSVEKDRSLVVSRLDKDEFLRQLEIALRMGHPMLIESVPEDIDPVVYPVIAKQTFKDVTSGTMIKIGEEVISYHPNFRCVLSSKFTNPAFSAEVTCKACVINFMITREGLEDQLLELTVSKERLDLEESRVRIIEQNHQNSIKMAEIESEILSTLQNVEGNILDDEEAIKTLKMSNDLSQKIKERQKNAAASEKQNEEARKVYRKLAHHGMLLYFAVQSLSRINKTYEYSLVWFSKMYVRSLELAEKSNFVEQRIESVNEQINGLVYSNVCRGLYEKDKLIFGLILASTLLKKDKKLNEKQFNHMLAPYDLTKLKDEKSPLEWLPDSLWRKVRATEVLEGMFGSLAHRIQTHPDIWEAFFTNSKPDDADLPEPLENASDLERLILLRALRPEALSRGLKKFVANSLGKDFVRSPGFDLDVSYNESTFAIPLVFLLPGVTPLVSLEAFALKMKKEDLRKISLGQGQAKAAEREIEEAKVTGNWVILENCHLYPSWMPRLGQICEDLSDPALEAKVNPTFRLWLTTYPCPEFPLTVLQNSVKMSNEPPAGLGASMEQSFRSPPLGDEQFLEGHPNSAQLKTLAFALCLFHSIVQERRQYGPLGWNIPYEFSSGDLRVSLLHLAEFTKGSANSLPYKALHYMLGECNYGGRVTDAQDRRLLMALLKETLTPRLFYAGHRFAELDDYEVPPVGTRDSYLAFAARFPSEQPPELCGLHPNAVLSRAAHETDRLLNGLAAAIGGKSVDGPSGESTSSDDDKLIGPISELKNKIPPKFVEKMVNTKFQVDYEQSMNTVLQQEVARYNRLLECISSSLSQMIDGLRGDAVISEKIEEALDSILQKKVPKLWLEASYPSLKPLASYVDDLCNRIAFLTKWVDSEAPPLFWLPGFYFPQSFLTAILQNYARKHKIAVDLLEFDFEFGPVLETNQTVNHASETGMNSEEGCLVYGLFFEGCGWDNRDRKLTEPIGREITAVAPVICLKPTKNKKRDEKSEFTCPLYKTPERRGVLSTTGHSTNFVMGVDIYTDVEPSTWVKRGAALLCQLPE